jgi:hypothetical protein
VRHYGAFAPDFVLSQRFTAIFCFFVHDAGASAPEATSYWERKELICCIFIQILGVWWNFSHKFGLDLGTNCAEY